MIFLAAKIHTQPTLPFPRRPSIILATLPHSCFKYLVALFIATMFCLYVRLDLYVAIKGMMLLKAHEKSLLRRPPHFIFYIGTIIAFEERILKYSPARTLRKQYLFLRRVAR